MIVRTDIRFYEDVPGYPRLVGRKTPAIETPTDSSYFHMFPEEDDEPPAATTPPVVIPGAAPPGAAIPVAAVHAPHAIAPIDVIELSDSLSGVNNGIDDGEEVQGGNNAGGGEGIADRVMARRRVHCAEFGDLL